VTCSEATPNLKLSMAMAAGFGGVLTWRASAVVQKRVVSVTSDAAIASERKRKMVLVMIL
jgi:hypothetical protein